MYVTTHTCSAANIELDAQSVRILRAYVVAGQLLDHVAVEVIRHSFRSELAGVRVPLTQITAEVVRAGLMVGIAVVDVAEAAIAFVLVSTRSYSIQLSYVALPAESVFA
jgi:hypothetical protein